MKATDVPIVLGRNGFIGSALAARSLPPAFYFFGSPSSNILFDDDLDGCMRETIDGFLQVLARCRQTGEYLVYASSATVKNKNTTYARCKAALEELHHAYASQGLKILGLRIAAGYGPGEGHKGRYASVIYQWCQQMQRGERPVIYGDGTQTRDFIYIDDIADTIARYANEGRTGIEEIGSGVNTSFNEAVRWINRALGQHLEPVYVPRPAAYVDETPVRSVPCQVSLASGILRILAATASKVAA